MCLAGEGGGKGRLKNLRGVDRAGDGDTPAGSGLAPPAGYGLGQAAPPGVAAWWYTGVVDPDLRCLREVGCGVCGTPLAGSGDGGATAPAPARSASWSARDDPPPAFP